MQFDNILGQGKPDTCTGRFGYIRYAVFRLVETVEYFVDILFVDPDAVVDYFDDNFFFLVFQDHFDGRIRFCVFECVG